MKERVRYIMIDPDATEEEGGEKADRKLARLFTHVTNEAKVYGEDDQVAAADLTDGFYTDSDEDVNQIPSNDHSQSVLFSSCEIGAEIEGDSVS